MFIVKKENMSLVRLNDVFYPLKPLEANLRFVILGYINKTDLINK